MPLGGAARSRASLVAAQAMPAIAEDDSVAPDVPKRSASRRTTKPITPAAVYNYNYNYAPFSSRSPTNSTTPTASSSDGTVPDRKPENNNSEAIRREERLARRRRWHCILMIAFLLIAVIVGLSVGLTLGLRKKKYALPSPIFPPSLTNNPAQHILRHSSSFPLKPLPSRQLHPHNRLILHQHILLI